MARPSDQPPGGTEGRRPDAAHYPGETVPTPRESHTAQDVRQGEIILRSKRRRWIFFGGIAAGVLLALILSFL